MEIQIDTFFELIAGGRMAHRTHLPAVSFPVERFDIFSGAFHIV
jgi:hypothetical protein